MAARMLPVTMLRLPPALEAQFRAQAAKERIPMAVLLRLLVDEYVDSGRLIGQSELPPIMGRKRA